MIKVYDNDIITQTGCVGESLKHSKIGLISGDGFQRKAFPMLEAKVDRQYPYTVKIPRSIDEMIDGDFSPAKEIVVKDIAAKEGLDNLTDEDKEAFAQANGTSKDTLVSLYGEDTVNEQVLQDKVLRFLASNADNEAENPAKLSEREVTVTETSADQESSPEETTEAETTAEETKAN